MAISEKILKPGTITENLLEKQLSATMVKLLDNIPPSILTKRAKIQPPTPKDMTANLLLTLDRSHNMMTMIFLLAMTVLDLSMSLLMKEMSGQCF